MICIHTAMVYEYDNNFLYLPSIEQIVNKKCKNTKPHKSKSSTGY